MRETSHRIRSPSANRKYETELDRPIGDWRDVVQQFSPCQKIWPNLER